MSAYVIFIRKNIKDAQEMDLYTRLARDAQGDFKIKPLSFYGETLALENIECEKVAILEFETIQEAKDWYYSNKYQEAKKHREKAGDYIVLLTEGLI